MKLCGKTCRQQIKEWIVELKTLIVDLSTKNNNKIGEKKILINIVDEINSRMTNTMDNHIKRAEIRLNVNLQKDKKRGKDTNVYKPVT